MIQRLAISDLRMERTLAPGDDVSELAAHIHDSGMKFPILVSPRGLEVIDGVRRVEAARLLGNDTIEAFIPSTLVEGIDHLKATLEYGKFGLRVGPRRMSQLKRDFVPLVYWERSKLNRGFSRTARKPARASGTDGSVKLLAALFGVSKSYLASVSRIFALEGTSPPGISGEELQELLEGVEQDTLRPGTVVNRLQQRRLFQGDIRAPQDQRDAFRMAIGSINGVLHGIAKLGPLNPKLAKEELVALRATFIRLRQFNNKLINAITEEINSR